MPIAEGDAGREGRRGAREGRPGMSRDADMGTLLHSCHNTAVWLTAFSVEGLLLVGDMAVGL